MTTVQETPEPVGTRDLEDLRAARLLARDQDELLCAQTECTFTFVAEDGGPAGVVMSFAYHQGRFWFTSVDGRAQVRGVERNPRVGVVVSNAGTGLYGRRMLSLQGDALLHRGEETAPYALEMIASRLAPHRTDEFLALLRSPGRVLIEVRPTEVVASHDSRRLAGDGRGGGER